MTLTTLAEGFCFGEGPRWFDGRLWFSDMLGEAIHSVDLAGSSTRLPLPGHAPSGLGFRPDGTLLVVSTRARQLLRLDGGHADVVADLSRLVPADLGDMVVDDLGRAYVGSQARSGGVIVRVDPDGAAVVAAGDLDFPNGMALTEDRATLIVAESTARRLTSFAVGADGGLSGRSVFADGLDGPPDGICLDAGGGVWAAMTLAGQFERITFGGTVTDRIGVEPAAAIACALGGPERRTLFLLSSPDAYLDRVAGTELSRLDTVTVDIPGAGLP